MKSWVFEKRYSEVAVNFKKEDLTLKNGEIPKAGDEEIVVKVHAVGLNPVDYIVGCFVFAPFPIIPGVDVAGIVHEVGSKVTNFKPGDRVHYMGKVGGLYGAFSEYAVVESVTASKIPENVTFEQAAAIPCAGGTAYIALHRKLRVREGETVLITAGAGGVGGYAIQLAKLAKLEVITTCSSKNTEFVKKLGADHVIDYNTEDIEKRVKEITNGRGVDAWIDLIGTDSADIGLKSLAYGGAIVIVQENPKTPLGDLFTKQQSIHQVCTGGAYQADRKAKEDLAVIMNELVQLVSQGKVDPLVKEVITFEQIPEALERIKAKHVAGKIVAKIIA